MTRAVLLLIAFTSGPLLFAADLSGRVVDSQDGTPVPRAHVTFALPGEHPFSVTVSTDAVGNFRVTNLPEGDLQLSTEKAGYIGETSFPAADAKTVVLHLTRQAIVMGSVMDDKGAGVPFANVQLYRPTIAVGRRNITFAANAQSDETGEFRIFGIGPGRYYIAVNVQAQPIRKSRRFTYEAVLYPGVKDFNAAQLFDLRPGTQEHVKIELRRVPAYEISAQCLPAQSLGIALSPQTQQLFNAPNFISSYDKKTGVCTLSGLPPGEYTVQSILPSDGNQIRAQKRIVIEDHDIQGLVLDPSLAHDVSVTVAVSGRAPESVAIPGVALCSSTSGCASAFGGNGPFQLSAVFPGTYRLDFVNPQMFSRIIRQGGREVDPNAIVIGEGQPDQIEIELTTGTGKIEGAVNAADLGSTTSVNIGLYRRGSMEFIFDRLFTVGGLRSNSPLPFAFESIAPGEYILLAWPATAELPYAEPDFINQFSDQGKAITVAEGEKVSVFIDSLLKDAP